MKHLNPNIIFQQLFLPYQEVVAVKPHVRFDEWVTGLCGFITCMCYTLFWVLVTVLASIIINLQKIKPVKSHPQSDSLIPLIINLLSYRDDNTLFGAETALKEISGKDYSKNKDMWIEWWQKTKNRIRP